MIYLNDKEIIDRYLKSKFKDSGGSYRNLKSILDEFFKHIKKPLVEIDYDDIYNYLDNVIDKKEINLNTKETYRYSLSGFFKYCEVYFKRKKIDFYGFVPNKKNYKFIKTAADLKDPAKIETKTLTDEQLEKIMDHVYLDKEYDNEEKRIRDFIIIILAITTGARISEIRTLQVDHLNIQGRYFTTGHIKNARKSTLNKEKALLFFFPESIIDYLETYLDIINNSEFLFPTMKYKKKDKPLSTGGVNNIYKEIRKEIGIYFSWHYFRKTLITRRAKMGILPWQSEGLMNHSPSSVEGESYIKLNLIDRRKLADKFYPYKKLKYIGDKNNNN